MIATKQNHIHKFVKQASQKVLLYNKTGEGASVAGTDLVKMKVCKCGKTEAYDLVRSTA